MPAPSSRTRRFLGFTLIELMITVAILAVLGAVAFPSYLGYLKKSRRGDARTLLQSAQFEQEKFRAGNVIYANAAASIPAACAGATASPCKSQSGYYQLTFGAVSATDYAMSASAVGSQLQDSGCTVMTVSQASGVSGFTYTPAACWGK